MDTRAGRLDWSNTILRMLGIPREKLPELVPGTEIVGTLTASAGVDLGLPAGVPVVAGAGDVAAMTVGTGAVRENEFHLAIGTSAWIATHVSSRQNNVRQYIASICSAHPDKQLLVAHQETGGACLEWARTALGGWMGSGDLPSYKDMDALAEGYEAGVDNLLFLPWMSGEYSPVEDPHARAGFINLSFNHELGHMVRAVYEGVALNARWALTAVEKMVGHPAEALRFAGGGAASEVWCQILADVTGRKSIQLDRPRLAAARGAALIASHALGLIPEFDDIGTIVTGRATYEPREETLAHYDEKYALFTDFYKRNRGFFKRANPGESSAGN
jgi:xylulokinase